MLFFCHEKVRAMKMFAKSFSYNSQFTEINKTPVSCKTQQRKAENYRQNRDVGIPSPPPYHERDFRPRFFWVSIKL